MLFLSLSLEGILYTASSLYIEEKFSDANDLIFVFFFCGIWRAGKSDRFEDFELVGTKNWSNPTRTNRAVRPYGSFGNVDSKSLSRHRGWNTRKGWALFARVFDGFAQCDSDFWTFVSKTIFHTDMRGIVWGSLLIIALIGTTGFAMRSARAIKVKTVEIPVTNLTKESTILYLSDIHISHTSDLPFLKKIIAQLNTLEGEFVVINGDFIDGKGFSEADLQLLNSINKDVYLTLGNHEAYAGNAYVKQLLKNTKIRLLEDEVLHAHGWELIWLADMAGFDTEENHELLDRKLATLLTNTTILPKLLILHEPIGPQVAEQHGINLQLAGHTHYGQIFPFTLAVKIAFPYIKGLYRFDTNALFVSSGIWTWGPAMRLGSRSELVVLKLIPKG